MGDSWICRVIVSGWSSTHVLLQAVYVSTRLRFQMWDCVGGWRTTTTKGGPLLPVHCYRNVNLTTQAYPHVTLPPVMTYCIACQTGSWAVRFRASTPFPQSCTIHLHLAHLPFIVCFSSQCVFLISFLPNFFPTRFKGHRLPLARLQCRFFPEFPYFCTLVLPQILLLHPEDRRGR
jgi:hypothetical protein